MTDSNVISMSTLIVSALRKDFCHFQTRSEAMIANNSKELTQLQQAAITSTVPGSEMLTQSQWNETAEALRLTNRETQVCQKLFEGITRNQIAEDLGIKPRTVRHYMEHIHEKLAVKNRVGVVLRIIQLRDELKGTQVSESKPRSSNLVLSNDSQASSS